MSRKWTIIDGMVLVGINAFALMGAIWLRALIGLPSTPSRNDLVLNSLFAITCVLLGLGAGVWLRRPSREPK